MRISNFTYKVVLSMMLSLGLGLIGTGATSAESANPVGTAAARVKVAVLPFVNNSASIRAVRVVSPILDSALIIRGFNILPSDSLRTVLRAYRIRTNGMINAENGKVIADATSLDYLVVGSVDIFEESATPEIGISVRILDLKTMKIAWTATIGATGQDYVGLFGVGIVDSADVLIKRAVNDQIKDLSPVSLAAEAGRVGRTTCAVVPCEDYSDYPKAGDIMTDLFVSELFRAGYDVIEPGVVEEVMLRGRSQSRGKVDHEVMDTLAARYGAKLVFTGSVDQFQAVRGNFQQASPEVSLGIRVIDASSHQILAAYDKERTGDYSETVFRLGACHSLERLTAGLLGEMIHKFTSHEGKTIADKN